MCDKKFPIVRKDTARICQGMQKYDQRKKVPRLAAVQGGGLWKELIDEEPEADFRP